MLGHRCSPLAPLSLLVLALSLSVGSACSRAPRTPEEKRARAEELLKRMSDQMAAAKTFAFSANVVRERVKSDGTKVEERTTQRWTVRRPDGFTVKIKGTDRDSEVWYDGKRITFLANLQKKYAQGPIPPKLDDALDFIATHYDVPMPMADLLYSNPYEALMTPDTKGGWVGTETIEGQRTDHLAFQSDVVDWEIWITDQARPRQFQITYKQDPGQPRVRYSFYDPDMAPKITGETFAAKIPAGYERLKLVLREGAPIPEPTPSETAPPASQPPAPATPPK
jgi:hypothetical protein